MERRTVREYLPFYLFALYLLLIAVFMGDISTIAEGLKTIIWSNGILITDYVGLAGIGAAFTNAALVTFFSAELLRRGNVPLKGKAIFVIGLMSGFALFGKNIFNMWPFVIGAFLNGKALLEAASKEMPDVVITDISMPVMGGIDLASALRNLSENVKIIS